MLPLCIVGLPIVLGARATNVVLALPHILASSFCTAGQVGAGKGQGEHRHQETNEKAPKKWAYTYARRGAYAPPATLPGACTFWTIPH
jgi:hypothetical protein